MDGSRKNMKLPNFPEAILLKRGGECKHLLCRNM
jgi:hypothetical protein